MQARGLLMIEHRLIERMIAIIVNTLDRIRAERKVDPVFIDTVVDFIRVYADLTHHGKEEDILFAKLKERSMSAEDREMMDDLINEHVFGRETTAKLVGATSRYRNGDEAGLDEIVECLDTLTGFYPKHIEKEDTVFFPASREYFTEAEDQEMLADFREFDQHMIHKTYTTVVEKLES